MNETVPHPEAHELDDYAVKKSGTSADKSNMRRMGKRQAMPRLFQYFNLCGFGMVLTVAWETSLINVGVTLPNGGTAGTLYVLLTAIFCFFFSTLSMAEMASMAPTAGGQYHWTSEFAPRKYQKGLSFFCGAFAIVGWQTALTAVCYGAALQLGALGVLTNSDYEPANWEITLISWAVLGVAVFFNTVIFQNLPFIEGFLALLHYLGFIAIITVLWVMAPQSSPSFVFTKFQSHNGWSTAAMACFAAANGPVYLTGADSQVHLAEELNDAARVLPRAMLVTSISNYISTFAMLVTLMFCLGDFDSILNTPTGQPYIGILLNATKSVRATKVLTVVILITQMACAVNLLTTSSRQLWSFARDKALPRSSWIEHVSPKFKVPLNAMLLSIVMSMVLTSIAIGSNVAYANLLSLNFSGLLTSYIICTGCILYKRLFGDPLPDSVFKLGKSGVWVNGIAFVFLFIFWVFQFLPLKPHPTLAEMNWSAVLLFAYSICSLIYYFVWARHAYVGPIEFVKKD